jgi:hypothetical protein
VYLVCCVLTVVAAANTVCFTVEGGKDAKVDEIAFERCVRGVQCEVLGVRCEGVKCEGVRVSGCKV